MSKTSTTSKLGNIRGVYPVTGFEPTSVQEISGGVLKTLATEFADSGVGLDDTGWRTRRSR